MADEPKKNEGTFCCKCLWTGTLSFTPEELAELEGEIRRYMGPCPECGKNSLQLAQEPSPGHDADTFLDRMEESAANNSALMAELKRRAEAGESIDDLFADKEDLDV